jgi:membrane protein implicated in regulation of membrane protease activity
MRWLFVLGVVALVDGLLALADAYSLRWLAVILVLAGILVTSMYVWRRQKRQRRHRRWFEEG